MPQFDNVHDDVCSVRGAPLREGEQNRRIVLATIALRPVRAPDFLNRANTYEEFAFLIEVRQRVPRTAVCQLSLRPQRHLLRHGRRRRRSGGLYAHSRKMS